MKNARVVHHWPRGLRFGPFPEIGILLFFFALICGACVALASTAGCGGAAEQHRTLNTISDVVDPSYDAALSACDAAEDFIVRRQPSTIEADRADIARIREACDRVFGAFELVRLAHRSARAAVDSGAPGAMASAMADLAAAWDALRRLLPEFNPGG